VPPVLFVSVGLPGAKVTVVLDKSDCDSLLVGVDVPVSDTAGTGVRLLKRRFAERPKRLAADFGEPAHISPYGVSSSFAHSSSVRLIHFE